MHHPSILEVPLKKACKEGLDKNRFSAGRYPSESDGGGRNKRTGLPGEVSTVQTRTLEIFQNMT